MSHQTSHNQYNRGHRHKVTADFGPPEDGNIVSMDRDYGWRWSTARRSRRAGSQTNSGVELPLCGLDEGSIDLEAGDC